MISKLSLLKIHLIQDNVRVEELRKNNTYIIGRI